MATKRKGPSAATWEGNDAPSKNPQNSISPTGNLQYKERALPLKMDMKALVQIQKPVFWETLGKIFEMASMLRKLEMAYLPAGLEEVKFES